MCFNFFVLLSCTFILFFYYKWIDNMKLTLNEIIIWFNKKKMAFIILLFLFISGIQFYFLGSEILQFLIILFVMYLCSLVDIRCKLIPNTLLLVGIVTQLLQLVIFQKLTYTDALSGLLIGFLIFLGISILSKGGLGMGDVKLIAISGLSMGVMGVLKSMVLSILISGITSIFLIVIRKINTKDTLPFAPFIYLGAVISILI